MQGSIDVPVYEVEPKSTLEIRELANQVREMCGANRPWFQIINFVELVLPKLMPDFDFQVVEFEELGGQIEALTYPNDTRMLVRKDVYDRACTGNGRDRFTIAHELGHLLMHRNVPHYARTTGRVVAYRNSEWQANQFAAELLMPLKTAKAAKNNIDLADSCGVSHGAAACRIRTAAAAEASVPHKKKQRSWRSSTRFQN